MNEQSFRERERERQRSYDNATEKKPEKFILALPGYKSEDGNATLPCSVECHSVLCMVSFPVFKSEC
jgi:hypothetical protein